MASTLTTPVETGREADPLILRLPSGVEMNDRQFLEFCAQNEPWRFERDAEGRIWILTPTGYRTLDRNSEIATQLRVWAKADSAGKGFGPDGGFRLPNGAIRSPDACWIQRSRLRAVPKDQREEFLPLCPDFVIELRSPSDRLDTLKRKMAEYVDNGTRLAWLIDPQRRNVHVYRPGKAPKIVPNPMSLSAAPELAGFVLDLEPVWDPED